MSEETTENMHHDLHVDTEDAIRSILDASFPNDAHPCRADVLIYLLNEEISAMEDRSDVLDATTAMMTIVLKRTIGDAALLLATEGNA